MDLYRYISFEEFMSIVTLKHLHFVQPTQWADTYEGCLYKMLDDNKNIEKLLSMLYDASNVSDENIKAKGVLHNYYKLLMVKYNWFGQCWTDKSDESDAFWRIYSYNDRAIRIHTSVSKLDNLLNSDMYIVERGKVVYNDYSSEDNLLESQIQGVLRTDNTTDGYFHKRNAFSHEQEYRILVLPKEDSEGNENMRTFFLKSANAFAIAQLNNRIKDTSIKDKKDCIASCMEIIKNQKFDLKKAQPLYIPIDSASDLITDVLVTPLAADWYVDLVKGVCDQNGIIFAGKSHLYDAVL